MGGRKTVGKIIGETIEYYRKNFKVFLITAIIVYGFTYLLATLSEYVIVFLGIDETNLKSIASFDNLLRLFNVSDNSEFGDLIFFLTLICSIIVLFLSSGVRDFFALPADMVTVNAYDTMLRLHAGERPKFNDICVNFMRKWIRYLGISAWSRLWIWLWTWVLFIPGIVKTYSYLFGPFLIIENPDMTIRQALKKSIEITNGYKGRLFGLSFCIEAPFVLIIFILTYISINTDSSTLSLIVSIFSHLAYLLIIEPLSYMMYVIAYRDIKQAAIEKELNFLPPQLPTDSI